MAKDAKKKEIKLLEEILKWVKFFGWGKVKDVLKDTLKKKKHKLAYHYSDGRSTREVSEKLDVSHVTISNWWKKWAKIGIVESVAARRGTRYQKIFPLEEFGIEVPANEKRKKTKE